MNLALQNYLVYTIVGGTFIYLVAPFVRMILGFFRKKESQNEDDFSCYTGSCAKCELTTPSQSPAKKTTRKAGK